MRKKNNLFTITAVFLLLMILFTSCLKDDGDNSLNNYWLGFGMIEADSENSDQFSIVMDAGDRLLPMEYESLLIDKVKDGDRVLINFTKLGEVENSSEENKEVYIRINKLEKILTKDIHQFSESSEDSIGNDPIIVSNGWVANDLINLELQYWAADKEHLINLVKMNEAKGDTINLYLKHNANDDVKYLLSVGYVSFYVEDFQIENKDSLVFNIFNTDYDDVTHKNTLVYHY